MTEWLEDANGNRCSVQYWGSREAAQRTLDSLVNCKNCTNCSDCSNCSYCSGCTDCSYCSYCSDCTNCSDCSNCSYCSGCTGCSGCSNCSNISRRTGNKNINAEASSEGEPFVAPPIPKIENIHQKIYEAVSQPEALDMSDWHTCNTTHCRAGWAVHLAGDAGYELERFHGSLLAGQLIYRESGYPINPCRFFDNNEDALADMKRLAEQDT